MSNMIKAYAVRYDDEAKKTIDSHLKKDQEIEQKRIIRKFPDAESSQDGFVEGLQAVVIEELPNLEETNETAAKIIEDAKKEAELILEQAKKEAEQLKTETYETAQKKGYEDGTLQVKKESQKLQSEYEEKSNALQAEYENRFKSIEPQMAQLIINYVEKITGIVISDKEEVILYLLEKSLKSMDKSDEYTIKVSKEDYEYVAMRKNLLLAALERQVSIYIMEDVNLDKNQCLIETDNKVINCSLDVQLNRLITDLKLISCI